MYGQSYSSSLQQSIDRLGCDNVSQLATLPTATFCTGAIMHAFGALNQPRVHIQARNKHILIRKHELLVGSSQTLLQPRNKALLCLDGGGLRGIITGLVELTELAVFG